MLISKWANYWIFAVGVGLVFAQLMCAAQEHDVNSDFPTIPFDHPAIRYVDSIANDPIARLQKRIDAGQARLEYNVNGGYLRSVLRLLSIPIDSQVLVFSKTSTQLSHISANTPRAVYFNDEASVGYVRGGQALEIAGLDPKEGVIFYTLPAPEAPRPRFTREAMDCLKCHMSPATLNIPGIVVSSLYPGAASEGGVLGFATDDRIPMEQRWGGWYVTGLHGKLRHRGNQPVDDFGLPIDPELPSQNITSLAERIDTNAYLAPTSDIVALMTLEHQTRMTNLITRIGWEARIAIADGDVRKFQKRLDSDTDAFVTYMLFADEASLPSPIQGVSDFQRTFPARGPRDVQGRSLRQFDLEKRLFRYPLSYMIYSNAFDAMPSIAREEIYRKIYAVLTGKDTRPAFARLSADDRLAVLQILLDTKPGLPDYWKQY